MRKIDWNSVGIGIAIIALIIVFIDSLVGGLFK